MPRQLRTYRDKGQALTLVLTAADFPHGFNLPNFNVRRDLVPGKSLELNFTPDRKGRFTYLCDIFCGDGHDRMSGVMVVTD